MDSFTQIILGIATAEIVTKGRLKNKTILYGSILGSIPDFDVIIGSFFDTVKGLALHRGMSHSLMFFIALSPLLGAIIQRLERKTLSFKTATLLVFWCLTTHTLLDMFTSWGTQVFWPLESRIAFKTVFVIDPLYTIPLLICLISAFKKPIVSERLKRVQLGLVISSAYLILGCGLKLLAVHRFTTALDSQQIEYSNCLVKPTALNCILWNANIDTKDAYLLADYSFFDSKPIQFKSYSKNRILDTNLMHNADFELLKLVSEGWYILSEKEGALYFNDLRFGLLKSDESDPQFAFSYIFIKEKGKWKAFETKKEKREGKKLLLNILHRIKGN